MTRMELRQHPGYIEAMEKIANYRPGFEFTIHWNPIPRAKANGLRLVLQDAREQGLIESISDDWGWDYNGEFNMSASTYRRTAKEAQA